MYIDYTQLAELQQLLNNSANASGILEESGITVPQDEISKTSPKIVHNNFGEDFDDEEEYEYILKKVPRVSVNRSRRATPALIPATEFLESINGSAAASSASVQTNNHKYRSQIANGYSEYELPEVDTSSRSSITSQQNYKPKTDISMGLDFFEKLRKIFQFGTSQVENESLDSNRKRSGETISNESVAPHIKYRKVENKFPKVISKPFEGDIEAPSCSRTNRAKQNFILDKFTSNMTQQEKCTKQRNEATNPRRNSLFNQPKTFRKKVSNAPFADIEFSDDEDCEIIGSINLNEIKPSGSKAKESLYSDLNESIDESSNKLKSAARPAKFCDIPISKVEQLVGKMGINKRMESHKPPPPPLIEPRTGGILAMTLMPNLQSINRGQNGYLNNENFERYRNSQIIGGSKSVKNQQHQRVFSSKPSTSTMNGAFTSKMKRFSNLWGGSNHRSIIAREQEAKSQEEYRALLQKVATLDENSSKIINKRRSISQHKLQQPKYQSLPKPTATIVLTDDEDENQDDIIITNVEDPANVTIIDDDDNVSEVIDLAEDEKNMISACEKLDSFASCEYSFNKKTTEKQFEMPYVKPINSFQEQLELVPAYKTDWHANFKIRWEAKTKENNRKVLEATKEAEERAAERMKVEKEIQAGLSQMQNLDLNFIALEEYSESDASEAESEEGEPEIFEFTHEQKERIRYAISGPRNEVLITKFNMNITRRDIETLMSLNWLNDEVINYYMNLLIERSDKRHQSHSLPKVYAMNTFFVPRLMEGGHSAVRRWTRKVNIFDRDIIPVPVHVGGVHWCMAIIHLKNQTIKYYDSMGTPNPRVLSALEKYLQDESMDKLKKPFDTSNFEIDSVRDVPRQMNGSDCGVFSCMFAEYITRNREITFTQEHMPYFREKMILEIVQGELLQ